MKMPRIYLLVILLLCLSFITINAEESKDNIENIGDSNHSSKNNNEALKENSESDNNLSEADKIIEDAILNIENNLSKLENEDQEQKQVEDLKNEEPIKEDKTQKEEEPIKEEVKTQKEEEQIKIVNDNHNGLYLSIFSIFFFLFAIIYLYGKTQLTNEKISKIKSKIEQNRREEEAQRLSDRQ